MTSVSERATVVPTHAHYEESRRRLARPILIAFLFTFMAARVLVFLIVARRIPDVYLNLGGTHVHHLNYGIFLLSAVGSVPATRASRPTRPSVGSGPLWHRSRADLRRVRAVVAPRWRLLAARELRRGRRIAGLLGLITVAPDISQFRPHHWATAAILAGTVTLFGYLLVDSLQYADRLLLRIQIIEQSKPPLR